MSKTPKQTKYCNCQISSNKKILKPNISYSYCEKCGSILIKSSQGTIYYTLKPKQKQRNIEINPINMIKAMKKKTEENYPFIYNVYNISSMTEKPKREKAVKSYLKHRKMLIIKLQQLMKAFDYCDLIFYQCLFYLDIFLSQDINENINEKTLLYYLVGYFLCSVKFREIDIYEPSFDSFFDLSKGIYLSPNKIAFYEVLCLTKINYNIFSYSSYDWLWQLISNGIVFNNEINSENEIILIKGHRHYLINTINKYAIKLLLNLTSKDFFFKYSPMYFAFSIIQIAREKYLDKKIIKQKLFFKLIELYGVDYSDYQKCYEEMKEEINEDNNKIKENKNEINNKVEEKKPTNTKRDSVDKVIEKSFNSFNRGKNLHVPNKIRSSNVLISLKDELMTKTRNDHDNIDNINLTTAKENKDFFNTNKFNTNSHKKHLSIDCKINPLKSNDSLPIIKINFAKDSVKKELNPVNLKSNIFLSKGKELSNYHKDSFNKMENDNTNINIRLFNKRYLTSDKLPKINMDELETAKAYKGNKIELSKEFNGLDTKKKLRLKTNKNLDYKGILPENNPV